jgi:ParB family chromosome partitioning protein
MDIQQIPIEHLRESGLNNRFSMDDAKLHELANSIRENGVIEPLIVRPAHQEPPDTVIAYEVICGNRRWQAAMRVVTGEICDCEVYRSGKVPCIVRDLTDEQAKEIILIENVQREDLHPMEEARSYSDLVIVLGSIQDVTRKTGKDARHVRQTLELMNLIPELQEQWKEGLFQLDSAKMLARLGADRQKSMVGVIESACKAWPQTGFISLRALKKELEEAYVPLINAPFDREDASLVPEAGDCVHCPKRSGNDVLLFPDLQEEDTCTDLPCFKTKCAAYAEKQFLQISATYPGSVKLSEGWQRHEGILARDDWKEVKGAERKDAAKKKILVSGVLMDSSNPQHIGRVLNVIASNTAEQGDMAFSQSRRTQGAYGFDQKKEQLQFKLRSEEDLAAVPVIAAAFKTPDQNDYVFLACEMVSGGSFELATNYCKAMGVPVVKKKGDYADPREAIKKRIRETFTQSRSPCRCREVFQAFVVGFLLTRHIGRARPEDLPASARKHAGKSEHPIFALAKRKGIDLTDALKPAAAKYQERLQRAAKRAGISLEETKKKKASKKSPR